jgi:hypothetical protein
MQELKVVSSWRALDGTRRGEGSLAVFIMIIFFMRNLIHYAKIHLCNFALIQRLRNKDYRQPTRNTI